MKYFINIKKKKVFLRNVYFYIILYRSEFHPFYAVFVRSLFWCWSFGLITHRSVYFILFFYIYFYISRGKHTTTKPFLSFSDILKYIKLEDIYIISFFYFLFLFFLRARFDDILLLLKYYSCIVLFSFMFDCFVLR